MKSKKRMADGLKKGLEQAVKMEKSAQSQGLEFFGRACLTVLTIAFVLWGSFKFVQYDQTLTVVKGLCEERKNPSVFDPLTRDCRKLVEMEFTEGNW
jgi:hypothetical protein